VSAVHLQGILSHPEPEEKPFFPKRFQFVGIDLSANGNFPAMLKHNLLRHWPIPELVLNAASFFGFLQFYSNFIPHFEVRLLPLCKIMSREYTEPTSNMWTPKVNSSFKELKQSVLWDPCLYLFDHCKLSVLHTNFSAMGFGYVVCQPGDDEVSLNMTAKYMSENWFGFMTKSIYDKESRGDSSPRRFWLSSNMRQ
jgi:hypothetical protein